MSTKPLRFLHLTTFYPPYSFGGDATYLYRLCHQLGDRGHQVDVVHCVDAYHLLHPDPVEIQYDEHPRVTRHELRSGWGWLSPFLTQQTGYPFLKASRIKQLVRENHYDVIHYHNTSLLGPKALELPFPDPSVKLYTTHEHWLVCPMHVLWKFNRQACDKPECLKCVLQGRRPPQLWRWTGMLKRSSRAVDRFVSPSRFTSRMHAARGFEQPVGHLPYFIDPVDTDWQTPAPRPHARRYFLFVGRLEKIKGLQTLIPLWKQVPDADLLVAGSGNMAEELRALAADNPAIHFLGPQNQRALGALYYHAEASIIPSITYETFGMISIESFARKTPVIVRDLGALPEVVNEAQGGFVYRTDEELLGAVRQLLDDAPTRNRLGEQGYRAFIEKWSTEAHLRQYYQLIDQASQAKYARSAWPECSAERGATAGAQLEPTAGGLDEAGASDAQTGARM